MPKTIYLNIKNIKAKDLKNLGFKSKAMATKFSNFLNISNKKSSSQQRRQTNNNHLLHSLSSIKLGHNL